MRKILGFILFSVLFSPSVIAQSLEELNKNFEELYSQGNLTEALVYAEKALVLAESELGKEHSEYRSGLDNLITVYFELELFDKALPLSLELLENTKVNIGEDNPEYRSQISNIATLYYKKGQLDQAQLFYQEALENTINNLGKNNAEYATQLNNLASIYREKGQYDKAVPLFEEVLEVTERSLGKNSPEYGTRLNNLANLYRITGQYNQALPLFLEAMEVTEKTLGKDHIEYSSHLNNLSLLYRKMGRFEEALPLSLEALKIVEKQLGKQHSAYSICLSNTALIYKELGQYENALPLYLEVLDITEKSLGKQHPQYGTQLNNLATFYYQFGLYDKALPLLEEALQNVEKSVGKQHPQYAIRLNNLGILYMVMERYEEALPLFLESLEITEKGLGKNHAEYATRLNNLGSLYYKMEKYEEALPVLLEALEITKNNLGSHHPQYANRLNNLANLYSKTGQENKALPLFLEALELTEDNFGREHMEYAQQLKSLAEFYLTIDDREKALSLYLNTIDILKSQINRSFEILSEKEKESFMDVLKSYFGSMQSFFSDYYFNEPSVGQTAYDIELMTKGLILTSSQSVRQSIEHSDDDESLKIYDEWFEKKSELAKQYSLSVSERKAELNSMEEEAENLEKKLIGISKDLGRLSRVGMIRWQDIQKHLKPNEVAIEFSSYHYFKNLNWTDTTRYMAMMIRKEDDFPLLVPLFTQAEMDKLLMSAEKDRSKVNNLYGKYIDSKAKGKKLYDLIWKPLASYLKEGNVIHFAPSGVLNQLAFAAVVAPDGRYLSDIYDLRQLSTTSKIMTTHLQKKLDDIALFGGIKYDESTENLEKTVISLQNENNLKMRSLPEDPTRKMNWQYLKGSLTEVQNIKSIAGKEGSQVRYYTGGQAVEEQFNVLNGKSSPKILHLATHGFFFPDPVITDMEEGIKEKPIKPENMFSLSKDPLNRSGLIFAGGNHAWNGEKLPEGIEDGILTAYEISNISLPNTELVVLSACNTGLGEIRGSEGVYGLQRSFKMAGVEYLLMSLWKIPDNTTSEYMQYFYDKLFDTLDVDQSYKAAQDFMKSKYPDDPYKWAGFILIR